MFFILRYFTMMKERNDNVEIPIFLSSDDFDLVQEAVTKFPLKKLQVLHSPLDVNDIAGKMQIAALGSNSKTPPKKFTKDLSPQKKSSKNELDIDLEFINVFISNTKKVISQMANVPELKSSPPVLMSQLQEPIEIDISARILISSSYFKGSYYIAFPKQTFFNFYEKVVMEKCTEINDENKDFASELANIIYGQCKKKFSDEGLNLEMVIPTLHMGAINNSVVVVIPFESPVGKFYLAVAPGLI
ncbi:MAG: chemotaxis protein CheX [Alphaproteobacteria bacterium]|nr:MAG: chemotaxis protein CheX [Alphaproteobacteria bacterium]